MRYKWTHHQVNTNKKHKAISAYPVKIAIIWKSKQKHVGEVSENRPLTTAGDNVTRYCWREYGDFSLTVHLPYDAVVLLKERSQRGRGKVSV